MKRRVFLGLLASPLIAGLKESHKREIAKELGASTDLALQFPGLELLKAQQVLLHNPTDKPQLVDIVINNRERHASIYLKAFESKQESVGNIDNITDIMLFGGEHIAATVECVPPQKYGNYVMIPAWQGLEDPTVSARSFSRPRGPLYQHGHTQDFRFDAARDVAVTHHIPLEKSLLQGMVYRTIVSNKLEEMIFADSTAKKPNGQVVQESTNFIFAGNDQQPAPINMALGLTEGSLTINTKDTLNTAITSDVQLEFEKYSMKRRVPSLTERNLGVQLAVLGAMHHTKGRENLATQLFVSYVPHNSEPYTGSPYTQVTFDALLHESRTNKWVKGAYTFALRAGTTQKFLLTDLTSVARKVQYDGNISLHEFDYQNCRGNILLRIPSREERNPVGRIGALVVPTAYWHQSNKLTAIGQPYLAQRL